MIDPEIEQNLRQSLGSTARIAGVDEVGRGPWAGPVTACAVVLDPNNIPDGLADSKALSAKKRDALFEPILASADVGIAHVSVEEIDRINILNASMLAMKLALAELATPANFALIDGNKIPADLPMPADCLVKGDARCLSIAAASIVAKVTRDRLMVSLAQQFPHYGWETNAGYGTKVHQEGLKNHGVTQHHRRSFKPIHNILCAPKTPNS
ncbi:ribonuclease HII [Amylibacter sp. IMCC11727]|uniref:ribonuclease HII n=1 Tax=Amylibacter sp. IMCC11727 TaxID=3039851 RepID=UPI00244D9BA9|nr:ribonuclease HII [Amylibacter sp. IMCC11727]WGI23581.1 ribonuclease HII [Amylibacter sp. IMCC11727]